MSQWGFFLLSSAGLEPLANTSAASELCHALKLQHSGNTPCKIKRPQRGPIRREPDDIVHVILSESSAGPQENHTRTNYTRKCLTSVRVVRQRHRGIVALCWRAPPSGSSAPRSSASALCSSTRPPGQGRDWRQHTARRHSAGCG